MEKKALRWGVILFSITCVAGLLIYVIDPAGLRSDLQALGSGDFFPYTEWTVGQWWGWISHVLISAGTVLYVFRRRGTLLFIGNAGIGMIIVSCMIMGALLRFAFMMTVLFSLAVRIYVPWIIMLVLALLCSVLWLRRRDVSKPSGAVIALYCGIESIHIIMNIMCVSQSPWRLVYGLSLIISYGLMMKGGIVDEIQG